MKYVWFRLKLSIISSLDYLVDEMSFNDFQIIFTVSRDPLLLAPVWPPYKNSTLEIKVIWIKIQNSWVN